MGSEPQSGSVDVPRPGRALSTSDKLKLKEAINEVSVMKDPAKRQSLLRELREALGPDFDPARFAESAWDSWEITSSCIQIGGMPELVDVLSLLGGRTQAWEQVATLVAQMFPSTMLRTADRVLLEQMLRSVPSSAVQQAVSAVGDSGELPPDIASADDPTVVLAWLDQVRVSRQGDGYLLWVFLENVAHASDEALRDRLHYAINAAAAVLGDGAYAAAREICSELLAEVTAADDEQADVDSSDLSGIFVEDPVSEVGDGVKTDAAAPRSVAPTPATAPEIWGGVPPKNVFFTGREDTLDALKRTLRPNVKTALLPQTLHGLGGVGKTQVAIEFAHRYRGDYDLVWWVPAEDERSIRRSLTSLARKLGLPESDNQQFTVEAALDELRLGQMHPRWLIVFDNAAEPEIVRPYLPDGTGHTLVTSRSRSWVASSSIIEVNIFRPEESIAFLTARWDGLTEEDALTLAEQLGHLPLALDQAVAVHLQTGMPLDEYLRVLKADRAQLLAESVPTNYPLPVAKTWRLAFDELYKRAPAAAQLLQVCAFISAQPISVPMLRQGRGASLPSPLDRTLRDELAFRKAVQEIGKFALASLDHGRDFLTIHMLVRDVLRDALDQDERVRIERTAHEILALANPGSPDRSDNWTRHAHIAPHVIPSGVMHSDEAEVRQVVIDQIRYYFAIGDFAASESLARRAVEDWRGRLGVDDLMTLRAAFHLGNALRVLGEYAEAREITQDTFQQLKRIHGEDHEYTLQVANSVGADLRILGKFDEAREFDGDILDRHRRVLGADDLGTLRAANNLAVDYRLSGNFRAARDLDADTVERRRALDPGENSPETLLSINNLVRDRYGLGEYAEALDLQRRRLPEFERHLRANHRAVVLARRNLAILWRKTGALPDALRQAESDYEVTSTLLGARHEHTLAAATTLMNTLRAAGQDLVRARTLGEATYAAYQDQFGREHPVTLACAVNLAIVYRDIGEREKATDLDTYSLAALKRSLGDDHPYTMCCAANTANNLAAAGDNEGARALSAELVSRSRRIRGERHPYTLASAANLALYLVAVGDHVAAQDLRSQTLNLMRQQLGNEHPQTVTVERGRRTEADIEAPPM